MFLDAAQAGAKLGLENQGQHNQAAEALGKLGLGYAENASRSNLAAAELAAHAKAAANALLLNQNKLGELADYRNKMVDYRSRENDIREQGIAAKEAAEALKHGQPFHVGNSLIKVNPDGTTNVLFDANDSKMNELDKLKYASALRDKRSASAAISKGDLSPSDAAFWQQKAQDADSVIAAIEQRNMKHGSATATDSLAAPVSPVGTQAAPADAQFPFGKPASLNPWEALSPQNGSSPPFINTQEQPGPTPATRMRYNPETKELEPY